MHGESRRELVIGSRLSEMARVESWLAAVMREWEVPDEAVYSVDLIVNEVVSNIISYAYPDEAAHTIVIVLARSDSSIVVEVADDGMPFNPLTAPQARVAEDLEHASVGGWGIPLIKAFSAEQHYAYASGMNRLRLVIARDRPS
jgi:anti-sigma regulatory factor (Ser/Thr protein kinase)